MIFGALLKSIILNFWSIIVSSRPTCGPDCVPAYLLQIGADFLAAPLSKLFQISLSSGILPRDWVTANIVPVYKKGDSHLSSNYRPISLTYLS